MTTNPPITIHQVLRHFSLTTVASLGSIFFLLVLPSEGNNALIFGYSKARVALLMVSLLIFVVTSILFVNLKIGSPFGKKTYHFIDNWSRNRSLVQGTQMISMIGFGVGSFLLITTFLTSDQYIKGILLRLSPLIGLGTLILAQINFVCIRIAAKPILQELLSQSIVWIFLNSIWFFITIQFLNDTLLFNAFLIIISTIFFFVIFSLEYFFIDRPFPQKVLLITIFAVVLTSFWTFSQIQKLEIHQILILLFAIAGVGQILFLLVSIYFRPQKRSIPLGRHKVNISTMTTILIWSATLFVILGIITQVSNDFLPTGTNQGLQQFFNLDTEKNLPAIYSSGLLLISAGLLLYIFYRQRKTKEKKRFYWLFLGLIFFVLSLDEFFSFHEGLIGPIRRRVEGQGVFSYEWVFIAIPVVLILGIAYFRFLLQLPPTIRNLIILAGVIYIGGSLGGEMMSGWYASNFGEGDRNYMMLTVLEETLEMTGATLFIATLLFYLYQSTPEPESPAKMSIPKNVP
jgi:hypothetical protein